MHGITRWQQPESSVWPAFENWLGLPDELDRWLENASTGWNRFLSAWNPAIDLYEDADNIIVKTELPGMNKEDIDVSLHDGALSISGERKSEQKYDRAQTRRSERFVGVFNRSLNLPTFVKVDQVKAHYEDGILTVTLPKAEEAKRKQIEVKVN